MIEESAQNLVAPMRQLELLNALLCTNSDKAFWVLMRSQANDLWPLFNLEPSHV
jgi:hypothetical protein